MEAATAVLDAASTPDRTLAQRMEALDRANGVRVWRAQMKRDLKGARLSIVPLIESPPSEMETMKLFDLLLAAPKIGRVKAMKMLAHAGVSPSKTVGGLSERQRRELLVLLQRR